MQAGARQGNSPRSFQGILSQCCVDRRTVRSDRSAVLTLTRLAIYKEEHGTCQSLIKTPDWITERPPQLAASFISTQAINVGYWSNNGQISIFDRDDLSTSDPYLPFTLHNIVASARDNRDAKKRNSQSIRENTMKTNYTIAIALVAG